MKSKTRNVLVLFLVLLVAGLGGLTALVFSSGFQTWAFRRAVAGRPEATIEVTRVEAGLSRARVSGLKVTAPGMTLAADTVDATLSIWDVVKTGRADLGTLIVRNAVIDLRGAPAAAPGAATWSTAGPAPSTANAAPSSRPPAPVAPLAGQPADFNGLLSGLLLPAEISIGKLDANARVLLPRNRTATATVTASDLGVGRRGRVEWKADLADATPEAAVSAVRATGTAGLTVAADGRVTALEADTLAAVEGPGIPADRLSFQAKAAPAGGAGDETYELTAGLERGAQVETVLEGRAEFQKAARTLAGTWRIAARSEQFAALLSAFNLPALAVTGEGRFSREATGAAAASGQLDVSASNLVRLSPGLRSLGAARSQAAFDLRLADNTAVLERLEVNLSTTDGRRLADVTARQRISYGIADGRLSFANPSAELARLAVQGLPVAWLQPWAKDYTLEGGELSLTLAVEAGTDAQRVRARAVEPVQVQGLTVRDANRVLLEQATITLRPDLEYTAERVTAALADLSVALPSGDRIGGTLSAQITNLKAQPAVEFTADLNGRLAEGFRRQVPELPAAVRFTASTQGRLDGDVLQVARYAITVNQDAGALLAIVEAAQPFRIDLAKGAVTPANPAATAVRARLGEVPLVWAEPFVQGARLGGTVAGGAVEVAFRSTDDVAATVTSPLTLRGVTASWNGGALVQNLDLAAELTASWKNDSVTYDVRRLEARQGETTLLRFAAAGSAKPGDKPEAAAKGTLEILDAGALSRQPALAAGNFTRGTVTAAFDATVGAAVQATVNLTTRNLTSRQAPGNPLNLDSNFTFTRRADGSGVIRLPLTLTAGNRRSDVTVDGSFTQPAGGYSFTGKISSTQLFVDDVQMLAGLIPSTSAPAGPRPAAAPTRPASGPFWAGMNGRVEADLKNVQSAGYTLSALRGTLAVAGNRVAVTGLEGTFRNNQPFKLAGNLDFVAGQARPYVLAANLDVNRLDVGEILRQANPNERPALETKVNVTGRIAASAAQPDGLLENLTGQFDTTGSAGVLRALGKKGETVNALSTVIGIFGAIQGSDTAVAAAQLATALNELRFEKFSVKVERGADLNLKLSALEMVSPIMRLTGTGTITHRPGVAINQQPLSVEFQLAGKDQLAQLLNRAGLLAAEPDTAGYFAMTRSFLIGGTAAAPDSSQLWAMIARATATAAGLLGR